MQRLSLFWIAVASALLWASAAPAQEFVRTYETKTAYETIAADLEDAIINRGYVINGRSDLALMLKRTAEAVGTTKVVYRNAQVFEFCSAVFSRNMLEADPRNIAFCPLSVFAYETEEAPGTVVVGLRLLPQGPGRDEVNALLDEIAREAAGL